MMMALIGLWVICTAVTSMIVIADDGDLKTKIQFLVYMASFLAAILLGSWLIAGGTK